MPTITLPAEPILKAQAHKLKAFLADKNIALSHMTCLEAIASQYGHASWNHLCAVLSTQPTSSPLPANVVNVDTALSSALMSYEGVLKSLAVRLAGGRSAPTLTQSRGLRDKLNDNNTRYVSVRVEIALDEDTTLSLELRTVYSNSFSELDVSGDLFIHVTRPGYGPTDNQGWRADMVEILEYASFNGALIHLDESVWQAELYDSLQGLDLERLVLKALSKKGSIDALAQEFSQRIPGWASEDLQFNNDMVNEYEVSVTNNATGEVLFSDTTYAFGPDQALSDLQAAERQATESAAKKGVATTTTVTLLDDGEL